MMDYLFGNYRIRGSHSVGVELLMSVERVIEHFSRAEAIFFFSYTINSSERQDHVSPANAAGHAKSGQQVKNIPYVRG